MLINIRGCSGSGKSTIVRTMLEQYDAQAIYDVMFGLRAPEAYKVRVPGVEQDTFIIGPYLTACGGCDAVQPFELIPTLIEKYAARGNVLFEGLLVSSCYGALGRALERYGERAAILFLTTPLETCIERVRARRAERGDEREFDPTGTAHKHATIGKLKAKVIERGMRVLSVSSETAQATIVELLQANGARLLLVGRRVQAGHELSPWSE